MKKKNQFNLHDAPLEMFIEELKENGGTPEQLLENDEFIKTFIPIIRDDYKIVETYNCLKNHLKFDFDISVLSGKKDKDMEDKSLELWQTCTTGKCRIYKFEGGHFFINEDVEDVVKVINDVLMPYA